MDTKVASKLQQFCFQFKHQNFSKGEILIRADDDPFGIYFLVKGTVKKYFISLHGEESIIAIFKPLSFFPMAWAMNREQNKYYYEALDAVEVWRAPAENVTAFIKENPDVLYDLLSRVYTGIEGLTERMVYLMGGSAYARLIVELLINIRRFGTTVPGSNDNGFLLNISEAELAAQTGLSRETISRELRVLKDKNLVVYEKSRLTVSDLPRLAHELAGLV